MASARVFNHVLYKRHAIISCIGHTSPIYHYGPKYSIKQNALYSTKKSMVKSDSADCDGGKIQVGFAEVVKENTKSVGYLGIIICGIGITVFILYSVFNELFSSKSVNGVYTKAFEHCMAHPKVEDALGAPMKAFGEETRRGRRGHVSHTYYMKDNVKHLRMRFYIQGSRRRGTVNLEVQENESGDYVYRYFYVNVENTGIVIKIEDNRQSRRSFQPDSEMELA